MVKWPGRLRLQVPVSSPIQRSASGCWSVSYPSPSLGKQETSEGEGRGFPEGGREHREGGGAVGT